MYVPSSGAQTRRNKKEILDSGTSQNPWAGLDVAGYSSALIEKYAVPPIQTIRKLAVGPSVNKGDILSVFAVLSLLLTIIFTPLAARYVWKSDQEDYEELEWDDPVAQTEKDFRRYFPEDFREAFRLYVSRRETNKVSEGGELVAGTKEEQLRRKVPKTLLNTEGLLKEVLESPVLREAVNDFIAQLLESERVNGALHNVLRRLWHDLVNDPETTAQVVQLLRNGIQNQEIKNSVRKLVLELVNDKEVYNELQLLVIRLGNEREILQATQALLTESAHKALNDPEILDHSMAFATDVVGDDVVQRTSGEALRNTVSYAVRPGLSGLLALTGVALLLFSLSALGNARASSHESELLDRAFSSVARSVQQGAADSASALLSLPSRLITFVASAVVAMVKAPYVVMIAAGKAISAAGNAVSKSTIKWIASISSFPRRALVAALSFMVQMGRSISNSLAGLSSAVSSTFAGSAIKVTFRICSGIASVLWSGVSTIGTVVSVTVSGLRQAVAEVGRQCASGTYSLLESAHDVLDIVSRGPSASYYIFVNATDLLTASRHVWRAASISVWQFANNNAAFVKATIEEVRSWVSHFFSKDSKPEPL